METPKYMGDSGSVVQPQNEADTPLSIAEQFREGIKAVEEDEQIKLGVTRTRKSRAPKKEPIPKPEWEPKKIGMVACYMHDAIFAAYDMPPLEPEETESLSATSAYYLNERWPDGAKYEPEMRMAAELGGLWVPRIMAKQRAAQDEIEIGDLGEVVENDRP